MRPVLHVLDLTKQARRFPILKQLQIEEALFRADPRRRNWLIVNHGLPALPSGNSHAAIIFGLGDGKRPDSLCHVERARNDGVSLVKRFSGGGTVYVDQGTVFLTFICNANIALGNPLMTDPNTTLVYPRPIMEWTGLIYGGAFDRLLGCDHQFILQENDYVFGVKKFGGNAQSISKDRWVHHTSLLHEFDLDTMGKYLKLPNKQPEYRQDRGHDEFLCCLKDVLPLDAHMRSLTDAILEELQAHWFVVEDDLDYDAEEIEELLASGEYRRGNVIL